MEPVQRENVKRNSHSGCFPLLPSVKIRGKSRVLGTDGCQSESSKSLSIGSMIPVGVAMPKTGQTQRTAELRPFGNDISKTSQAISRDNFQCRCWRRWDKWYDNVCSFSVRWSLWMQKSTVSRYTRNPDSPTDLTFPTPTLRAYTPSSCWLIHLTDMLDTH